MSTNYYLYCKCCNEEYDLWKGAYKIEDFTKEQLEQFANFIDKHQSHHLIYLDWEEKWEIENFEKVAQEEKELIKEILKKSKVPDQSEIVSVISKFIPIRNSGLDPYTYMGQCPFHKLKEDDTNEDTFIIGKLTQRFICAKCEINGDVNGFLKLWLKDKPYSLYNPLESDLQNAD